METDDNVPQDGAVARRSTDTVAATEGRQQQGRQPITTSSPDGAVARPSPDTVAATEGRQQQGRQPITTSTPDGAVARRSTDTVAATEGRQEQGRQPITTSTPDGAVARRSTDTVAATEGRQAHGRQPITTSTPDGAVARRYTDTVAATEGRQEQGRQPITTSTPDGAVARRSTDTVAATEGSQQQGRQPTTTSYPDGAVARPSSDTVAATEGRQQQGKQPTTTSTPDGAVARPSTDTEAATEGRQQKGKQPTTPSTPDGAVARPSTDTVAATEGSQQGGQPTTTSTPDGAAARRSTNTIAAAEGRQQQGRQPITTSTPDGAVARPSKDTVAATEGSQHQGGQPTTTSTQDGAVNRRTTDTVTATEGSHHQGGQPTTTSAPDGAVARPSTDTVAATEGSHHQGGQPTTTSTPDGAVARPSTDTVAATEGRQEQGRQPITTPTPDGAVARRSTDTVAATEGSQQQGRQPTTTSYPDGAVARPSSDTVAATEGRQQQGKQPTTTSTPDGAVARPSTDTEAATEGRQQKGKQPTTPSTPDGAVARPSTDTVAATEGSQQGGQPTTTSTPDGAAARRSTNTIAAAEGRQQQGRQPITTSTPDGAVARPSKDTVAATEGSQHQGGQPTTTSTQDGAVNRRTTDTVTATEGSHHQGGQPTTTSAPDGAVARPSTDTVAATEGSHHQGGQPTTTSTPDGAVARPSTDTVAATEGRQEQGRQPITTPTPDGAVARPSTDTVAATEEIQHRAQSISTTTHNYIDCTVSHYDVSNSPGMAVGDSKHQGCISQGCLSVRIKQLSDMFVETNALDKAQELLKRHNHVAICGAPGDGKTTAALRICEAYMKKKYQVLFVESIEEFDSDVIIERKCDMLVVFDDVFGSVTFPSSLEKIHRVFNTLIDILLRFTRDKELTAKEKQTKKKHNKSMKKEDEKQCEDEKTPMCNYKLRFIFTSRSYNWNEGCARLHQFKVNLFKPEAIVDMIKTCLTSDEKKRIMALFRSSQMCDISSKDMKTITQLKDSMFGYPLMCKLYFTNPVFQMHSPVDFFLKPLTYLRGDLDTTVREGSSKSAALVLLVLCGGKLDLISLMMGTDEKVRDLLHVVKEKVASCTDADISREISNFTSTYCIVENHLASFSHPSIYDAATCALGNLNIVLLVKHCSLQFLYERVRLSKTDSLQTTQTDDVTNMIQITSRLYPLLISRLVEGIREGCFRWTVGHPVFRNDQLASSLMTELANDLPHIVHEKDKTSGECFLYWVSLSNNDVLLQGSLLLISKNRNLSHESVIDLNDSAIGCVKAGIVRNLQHIVVVLKKHGEFDVDRRMQTNKTQLIIAAEAGHLDVFNFLLQEGANVSMRDREGYNCLHHACQSGNKDIVEVVVEKFPDMTDDPDGLGNTSAMLCVMSGQEEIFKVLVSHGADLKGRGYSCLHMACARGHISIVRYLLSYEDININEKTINEETPVMMAAKAGHSDVYHLLVSKGADLSFTDYRDRDCLMLACEGGNMSIVEHLLSLNTFNINRKDGLNCTPVILAAEAGHTDVYHLLVSEGADLSFTDKMDRDCLMLACEGGNMSIVNHLLSLKTFNINREDWLNRTPVMMAAEAGHSDVYHLLVSEGADLSFTDKMDRDCLMLACDGDIMSIVKHLLSLKTFNINRRDRFNCTPVVMAAEARHSDVYHLLVSEGADLSLYDYRARDCLMYACEGGNMSIVKHLLSLKTFNINRRDGLGSTPVMKAAKAGHSDVYHLLVSEGADPSFTDIMDRDCLMLACEGGDMSIVKHLLSLKTFNINRRDGLGSTPVVMAAAAGHSDVYHLLVSEGADLSFTDEMDRDCLMLACQAGNMSIVKHLLSLKTFNINRRDGLGSTPVVMAAAARHSDVYHLLVSEGADLSLTDDGDRDCLVWACEGGNIAIVKHLLSLKTFNIDRRDGLGSTPVMMAAAAGHSDVYHLLVSEGADVSFTNKVGRDCLMYACQAGNMSIVKHLLSLKTFNINRRDWLGSTPLMIATKGRHSDIHNLLASEGADLSSGSQVMDITDLFKRTSKH